MTQTTNAMADWSLDQPFIDRVMSQARTVDLVSFDVFDTALTRLVDSPADLFADVERTLIASLGDVATGFAQAREDAERVARLSAARIHAAEEIGLDAIYQRLAALLPPMAPHLIQAKSAELDAESRLLAGVPDILALTAMLHAEGIPYLFISDMYLPAAFITGRLEAAGYLGWQRLHVSSETGVTKATGRQWPYVLAQHARPDGAPLRILHVGDDAHADVSMPRAHGIETVLYDRARSERRVGGPLTASVLPFSLAQRDSVLRSRAAPGPSGSDDGDATAFWRQSGQVFGGIVLAGFVRWLEARVRRHRIDTLYFCARDGWLIRQAWRASGADRRTGTDDHYLCISRRPLNLARGYLDSSPSRLQPSLLGFLAGSDGWVTVAAALDRAGLAGDAALSADMAHEFGGLNVRLVWPEGTGRFERVLQAHAPAVHATLQPAHTALMGYLRQERFGVSGGRIGMVDLGWHATMQRSLRTLVEAEQGPISLHGFYYGLWPAALGNRYGAGPIEAAFASDFQSAESQSAVHGAVEILEELHGAPHGTVTSYRETSTGWQPIFADSPAEIAQYETATRHFQAGAIETVTGLFATGRHGTLRLDEITPEVVRATLGAVTLSPRPRELEAFSRLGHCATFDHARFEPLACEACPTDDAELLPALRRSGWRIGTIRRWIDDADPERAAFLRRWAHEALPHYGVRALRQFAA